MRTIAWSTAILLLRTSLSYAFTCSNFDSGMGATFSLADLLRSPDQPPFEVTDGDIPCTTNRVEQNYTYIFNICGTVPGVIPRACSNLAYGAAALQVDKRNTESTSDDYCYRVGSFNEAQTSLALLNSEDPTQGLQLSYSGDYCGTGVQRKFNIQLMCADKLNPVPTHALEYEHCVYTVTMPSVYGCPLECPVSNRRLCGGNGHCGYDEDKNAARCFCNNGYSGSDCSSTSSSKSTYSPALMGLIVTLFIIVVILAGSMAFMVKQMNAYKEDLAHYRVLKGSEELDAATV